jgi:hypothetical protein
MTCAARKTRSGQTRVEDSRSGSPDWGWGRSAGFVLMLGACAISILREEMPFGSIDRFAASLNR